MDITNPVTIHRQDYQALTWKIEHTQLHFDLLPDATHVRCNLTVRYSAQKSADGQTSDLRLDGVDLILQSIAVDGVDLSTDQYLLDGQSLTLCNLPVRCVVSIDTLINPQANTALEGLYLSSGNFCTQCEAEGFRKITYYPDRPDVLSVFDVTIAADSVDYPVLLSNGNQLEHKQLDGGRHQVHWHDPHPKPAYLFALVAGKLSVVEDRFVTLSGRDVLLQVYVQAHNVTFCDYAIQALKASMSWDEQVYGLEYDLERFMIVAVDDFNMGAMENKGLNIFNSKFVLADRNTSTDTDYLGVEAVIAHEYFHNWTGNRITCRDWFQLSLKEGLTVFRDQCFSSDMHSATVKRIEDVRLLRARQFAEDASPMAHPIRPDSYIEINNFYTLTVYEKGAEVIRMLHCLLGEKRWRQGMDVYVSRHDGSATTCDAFIDAMQSVTEKDLTQFRLWYAVAGTPRLHVREQYDRIACRYSLTVAQHTPDTPGQSDKPSLHIPLRMGLLDEQGNALPLSVGQPVENDTASVILNITEPVQTFEFDNINSPPTASLLRGFSAPVRLEHALDDEQLALLIAHDTDGFNRWEAVQRLGERVIMMQLNAKDPSASMATLNAALKMLLMDETIDNAFKAEALQLPTIDTLAEALDKVDYQALGAARDVIQRTLAEHLEDLLHPLVSHGRNPQLPFLDDRSIGMRRLANTALSLLTYLPDYAWPELARAQFVNADNMTDRLSALACLCHTTDELRKLSLQEFHVNALTNKLVMDKWFAVQATARRAQILDDVLALYVHADFDITNPNRVRALVASFAMNNPVAFHSVDGHAYAFVADRVLEIDSLNPQVAASLVSPLTRWTHLIDTQQTMMLEQLHRIMNSDSLSPDVYELVSKSLAQQRR